MYNFLGRHRRSPRTALFKSGHASSRRSTKTNLYDLVNAENWRLRRADEADSGYAGSEILSQDDLNEIDEKADIIKGLL